MEDEGGGWEDIESGDKLEKNNGELIMKHHLSRLDDHWRAPRIVKRAGSIEGVDQPSRPSSAGFSRLSRRSLLHPPPPLAFLLPFNHPPFLSPLLLSLLLPSLTTPDFKLDYLLDLDCFRQSRSTLCQPRSGPDHVALTPPYRSLFFLALPNVKESNPPPTTPSRQPLTCRHLGGPTDCLWPFRSLRCLLRVSQLRRRTWEVVSGSSVRTATGWIAAGNNCIVRLLIWNFGLGRGSILVVLLHGIPVDARFGSLCPDSPFVIASLSPPTSACLGPWNRTLPRDTTALSVTPIALVFGAICDPGSVGTPRFPFFSGYIAWLRPSDPGGAATLE